MDVKVLHQNAIEQIQSSFSIDGMIHCVTELVLNSFDAKATSIAVRVNLSTFTIQVVDNGKGISRESLEWVGQQYMTSKCHSLDDLKSRLKYYGFRGQSLWSICNISRRVKISTRQQDSDATYCKIIEGDGYKVNMVGTRSSVGTTITIEGFLEKLPVRQRCIKKNEVGNIKSSLEGLILIHPKVSVSLRDDATMRMVLQYQWCEDVPTALVKIHPEVDPKGFSFRSCIKGKTCVEAMFHVELYSSKKMQYVYANKRPVVCTEVQNLISSRFKNYNQNKTNKKKHPVFVIHVKCPNDEVDFQFSSTKTTVMFKRHENVKRCVDKILEKFLGEDFPLPKKQLPRFSSECGISQIDGAIQVQGVKRKAPSIQDDEEKEESTQKTSKIEVIDTPAALEHFALPKTAQALPIAIEKRNEWASRIDVPEEFPETEHHSDPPERHEAEMSPHNVTNTTFFTIFPHDEHKGKELIMDMFIKSSLLTPSKTVYQNKTGSDASSPRNTTASVEPSKMIEQKFVSVGVQTDDSRFTKVCSCGSIVNETKQVSDFHNQFQKPFDILKQTGCLENVQFSPIPKPNKPPRKAILEKTPPSKLSSQRHASRTNYGRNHFDNNYHDEKTDKIHEELRERKRNLKKIIMTPSVHKPRCKNDPNETISRYFKKSESFKRVPTNEIIETTDLFGKMSSQDDDVPNETITSKYFTSSSVKKTKADSMDSDDIKSTLMLDQFTSKPALRKSTPYHAMKKQNETISKYFISQSSQQSKESEEIIDETPNLFAPELAKVKSQDDSEIIVTLDDKSKRQVLRRDFHFLQQDFLKAFDTTQTDANSVCFDIRKNVSEIIHRMDLEENNDDIEEQPVWMKEIDDYGVKIYTNRISGIKMLNTPKEDWNVAFKPRLGHVPKGMSPILTDGGKVEDLSPNSKNILQNAIVQAYEDELLLIKWQNCMDNQDPKQFFEQIYREKSAQIESEIPNINKSKWAKHTDRILGGGRVFTRAVLENLQFIGQVDRKFIASFDRNTKLLLLFDQHAVHERIRVEILGQGYKASSTKLPQSVTMFLPRNDLVLIKSQQSALNALGLTYETISDGIIILTIPTCVFNKCKMGKNLVVASAEVLIKEILDNMKDNNGVLAGTPPIIQNIINSEACRGAIKFGDALSADTCRNLLKGLSECRLPFQCAHGRPTLTPLISLDRELDMAVKPNLRKLADV